LALDDVQLIARLRGGDRSAFAPLAERYSQRVVCLCLGIVYNRAAAEDLTQDCFLKAWRKLPSLREPEKFAGWLFGIARNLCLDWLRKQRRGAGGTVSLHDDDAAPPDPREGPRAELEQDDRAARIRQAVAQLPDKYREVIQLRYYSQACYQDIAATLQLSLAGVNQRLTRARTRLRESLVRQGLSEEGAHHE